MINRRILIAAVTSFCTFSGTRQLNTSQDDTKLCELQLSVTKFPDAEKIVRMNSPVKF